jgi:NAD(P)-dependent dehydrogenase (short-subunit alcohol dehydrogenase family)
MRLSGKVAIVTGATRGIGRACALTLASEGADVLVSGRDAHAGAQVCGAIEAFGRRATFHAADLAEASAARGVVEAAVAEFGRLDILVNNAGVFERAPALDLDEESWDRVLNVNLKSAFFCAQAAARAMLGHGGAIINISSDAAWSGGLNPCAHYAASKAGLASITRSLAKELAGRGIRVNAIAPGMIDTDMGGDAGAALGELRIPLGRYGTPDEVASAVAFLASSDASYMTGAVLNMSGGLFLDR